jgi:hypothetical protein
MVVQSKRVHGARCTKIGNFMPYRDPAQRAAWMREYRKRKRAMHVSEPLERTPSASIEGARDPWPPIIRKPAPQTKAPDAKLGRRGALNTALDLARPFPLGVLASQVCPYCYNSGYSSPGTRCSYCRSGER